MQEKQQHWIDQPKMESRNRKKHNIKLKILTTRAPGNKLRKRTTTSIRDRHKKEIGKKENIKRSRDREWLTGKVGFHGAHEIDVPEIPVALPELHLVEVRLRRHYRIRRRRDSGRSRALIRRRGSVDLDRASYSSPTVFINCRK